MDYILSKINKTHFDAQQCRIQRKNIVNNSVFENTVKVDDVRFLNSMSADQIDNYCAINTDYVSDGYVCRRPSYEQNLFQFVHSKFPNNKNSTHAYNEIRYENLNEFLSYEPSDSGDTTVSFESFFKKNKSEKVDSEFDEKLAYLASNTKIVSLNKQAITCSIGLILVDLSYNKVNNSIKPLEIHGSNIKFLDSDLSKLKEYVDLANTYGFTIARDIFMRKNYPTYMQLIDQLSQLEILIKPDDSIIMDYAKSAININYKNNYFKLLLEEDKIRVVRYVEKLRASYYCNVVISYENIDQLVSSLDAYCRHIDIYDKCVQLIEGYLTRQDMSINVDDQLSGICISIGISSSHINSTRNYLHDIEKVIGDYCEYNILIKLTLGDVSSVSLDFSSITVNKSYVENYVHKHNYNFEPEIEKIQCTITDDISYLAKIVAQIIDH